MHFEWKPRPRAASLPRHAQGRVRLWWLGVGTAVLVVAAGLWWQRSPTVSADKPVRAAPGRGPGMGGAAVQPVSVGAVERGTVRVRVSAIGTMSARATAVVRAKVAGELQKLHFKEGDEVKAGQLLAEIDARSYQAALAQVQGSLQRDQALLRNAQLDLKRYQELQAQDSIASQQVDTQAALVRQYQGTVRADQGQVDAAQLQLAYTRITAPIAGRLGLRQADLGNVVNPSDATGIVTISQVRPIDAAFSIPEAHIGTLAQQLAAGRELPVELWDRDHQQMLGQGRLNALDNTIDTATGTVKAKAAFDNADRKLFANQFVNVKLQVHQLDNVLTVPTTAVQNNYVYLVQPDHTVTQRRITVGVTDGDRVSVQGDLQPGDQVVTDGIDRLREGASVTVIAPDKAQQVDQAVQDAASQPRGLRNLPPEVRAKLAAMGPEERKAYLQKLRAERAAGAVNGGPVGRQAPTPAHPAVPPVPSVPGAATDPGVQPASPAPAPSGAGR